MRQDEPNSLYMIAREFGLTSASGVQRLNILFVFEGPKTQIERMLWIGGANDCDMRVNNKL